MKMPENMKHIITLATICFITASLLSGVYLLTRPKIIEQKLRAENQALKEVFPEAGYFEPVLRDGEDVYFRAYASLEKKKHLGYAFRAEAQGYSSIIETMSGVDLQGRITGIRILAQNETPGLGAKINEVLVQRTLWQAIRELFVKVEKSPQVPSEPWFCAQFKGKRIEENIQTITGATISSKGLIDSVREKAREVLQYEQQ